MKQKTSAQCCMRLLGAALLVTSTVQAAPDFSGVWLRYPHLTDTANSTDAVFAQGPREAYARPGGEPQLKEPYATQYMEHRKRVDEAEERGIALADSATRCLPAGMPAMMNALFPIEIMQSRQKILLVAEERAEIRRIYLNETLPPLDDIVAGYSGTSAGRWEKNTLVIETVGILEEARLQGMPHSDKLKVTERLRLKTPDLLEDEITLHDPDVFAKPYVFTITYKREPTYRLGEFVCDNNRYATGPDGGLSSELGRENPR